MNVKKLMAAGVLLLVAAALPGAGFAQTHGGRVIDALNRKPIANAMVTMDDTVVRTRNDGTFQITAPGDTLAVRAYGHKRLQIPVRALAEDPDVPLKPVTPKALYLSFYGIGSKTLRESALNLIDHTELNAMVIDVKGDRGMVAFKVPIPLASQVGAQNLFTIRDAKAMLQALRLRDVYTIARIVVFKDNPLASARPDLAVRRGGAVWHDREHLAWVDPFKSEAWDYNIAIAVEAAKAGFDEIQFDYARFPDSPGLTFSRPPTLKNRIGAINGFLAAARKALMPYNVFLAADIFGYVMWNEDDTHIGQQLEDLPGIVDYICPMLYPSGYQFGIPGYRNPVQHPHEIVQLSLEKGLRRTRVEAIRFRPWLQAFRDYAFGAGQFGGPRIRTQIDAAEEVGSDGWMLWNPSNKYTADGLK
ncbi:MAG TPA: putative glycoside hydrolase [Candidatus Binataceae bacterium]|nr:putative glycoside hydrolase [Candidatus Binataceae bacterium]